MKLIVVLLVFLFSIPLHAQTYYKCKTPDGKTIYQDRRCEGEAKIESVQGKGSEDVLASERLRRANSQAQANATEQQADQLAAEKLAAEKLAAERAQEQQISQQYLQEPTTAVPPNTRPTESARNPTR